jgi:hypothetical protein
VGVLSLLIGGITQLLGNSGVLQKLLIIGAFPVAMLSMLVLGRRLLGSWGAIVGATCYGFNPVIVADFIGGEVGLDPGPLWLYATFPLMIHQALKLATTKSPTLRDSAILSLLLGVTSIAFHVVVLLLIPIVVLLLLRIISSNTSSLNIGHISLAVVLAIGMQLPILANYYLVGSNLPNNGNSILADINYTYSTATVLNMLKMTGNRGSAQSLLGYNSASLWGSLGYAIVLVGVVALLSPIAHSTEGRPSPQRYMVLTSTIVLAFAVGFAAMVNSGLTWLLTSSPFGAALRNPVTLLYLVAFSLSYLLGSGATKLAGILTKKSRIGAWSLMLVIMVSIFVSNAPALDGTIGLSTVRHNSFVVPERYFEISQWLANATTESPGRELWLPYTYSIQLALTWIQPNQFGTILGANLQGVDTSLVTRVFEAVCGSNNNSTFASLLGAANVRFVVVDNEAENSPSCDAVGQYVAGSGTFFRSVLSTARDFQLVNEKWNFSVFEDLAVAPHTFVADPIFPTNSSEILSYSSNAVATENMIDPTSYRVVVSLRYTRPFILVMGESFDPGWEARIDGTAGVVVGHQVVNGFANGWTIFPTGNTVVIQLKFAPQETHVLILSLSLISLSTALGIIILPIVWTISNRHRGVVQGRASTYRATLHKAHRRYLPNNEPRPRPVSEDSTIIS